MLDLEVKESILQVNMDSDLKAQAELLYEKKEGLFVATIRMF